MLGNTGCHPIGMNLKYICMISHISTYKQSVSIITNRAVNNFNVLMVFVYNLVRNLLNYIIVFNTCD